MTINKIIYADQDVFDWMKVNKTLVICSRLGTRKQLDIIAMFVPQGVVYCQ